MTKTAFVLGNGISRKGIRVAELQKHGPVYGCNALYRTETPDHLVAVDPKMLLEIGETDYAKKHSVWSNYNHQYDRHEKIKSHVQFFKPSLGWSSGPTALRLAATHGFDQIYILGFDYQGLKKSERANQYTFNNVFADTRNYKKGSDSATFYGNWMNQTKVILKDFPNIQFYRVVKPHNFKPHDLEFASNFKHVDYEEFLTIYKIHIDNS